MQTERQSLLALADIELLNNLPEVYGELIRKSYVREAYGIPDPEDPEHGTSLITVLVEATDSRHLDEIKTEISGIGRRYVGMLGATQVSGVTNVSLRIVAPDLHFRKYNPQ